jgi:CRP-like cAMP-binding protein
MPQRGSRWIAGLVRWHDPKLELLATHPVFAGCTHEELVRLGGISEVCQIHAGDAILTQGDPRSWWVALFTGTGVVLRDDRPIGLLGSGDFCGECAIVRHVPSDVSLVALESATTVVLSRQYFLALIDHFPHVARSILHTLAARPLAPDSAFYGADTNRPLNPSSDSV